MTLFYRPLSRAVTPLVIRAGRPGYLAPHLQRRCVASSVTNKPASQSFDQTALNIKEETKNAAGDIAKIIAGANIEKDFKGSSTGFLGVTSTIAAEVPKPVMVFGLAGALPYLGASATTVYLARQAGLAASGMYTSIDPGVALTVLDQALTVQVTYGAVMLSFLGALHWGMEFAGYGGYKGYTRLALGAAPVLFAWPTLAFQPMTALALQWAGFTSLWYADSKATGMGWAPKWYSQYRFYLSILVGTCIIGSLAGCSYYGPVAGHGFISHDLDLIREVRKGIVAEKTHKVSGPIEAIPAGEAADNFVKIQKKHEEKEEEGEKKAEGEGEEKKE